MGEMVTFPSNGGQAEGYLAVPEAEQGPGLVVIQEWWGLNDQIEEVCDRYAGEGFVALAPDLYHGEVSLRLTAVARERDHLAHQYAPPNLLWSQLRIFSGFTTTTTRLAPIACTPSRTVSFSGPQ